MVGRAHLVVKDPLAQSVQRVILVVLDCPYKWCQVPKGRKVILAEPALWDLTDLQAKMAFLDHQVKRVSRDFLVTLVFRDCKVLKAELVHRVLKDNLDSMDYQVLPV